MRYIMKTTGSANINNKAIDWQPGDILDLTPFEMTVLTRGGHVGEKAKEPPKPVKRKIVIEKK